MSQVRPRRHPTDRPERVRVLAEPCACDDDQTCLWHYDQLADYQQTLARKQAGVRFGHGNGR
jgi:hypothetical protein